MEFLDPEPTPRLAGRYERGYLPHIRSQGQSYFVTFRLHGTLPQKVIRQYQAERAMLLAKLHSAPARIPVGPASSDGEPVSRISDDAVGRTVSAEDRHRLFVLYSEKIEAYLNAGRGDCWLRDPRIGEMVANALRFFDGQRYHLGAWVVMPNHVHVIVRPSPSHLLDEILKSWKGFTARQANSLLERTGAPFWAREYYDHVVRDDQEHGHFVDYTHRNPVEAGLCARGEDWLWSSAHPRWRQRDQANK